MPAAGPAPALRGILFDLDDTLADSSGTEALVWERVADVIAEHVPDVDREALRRRYMDVLEGHYAELAAGRIDFMTFRRRRLADALSPWGEVSDELLERYMAAKERIADEMQPFPEAIAVVRALRGLGIRVGVLTNGPSAFQRRKLEVSRLAPSWTRSRSRESSGSRSPSPRRSRRRSSSSARAPRRRRWSATRSRTTSWAGFALGFRRSYGCPARARATASGRTSGARAARGAGVARASAARRGRHAGVTMSGPVTAR